MFLLRIFVGEKKKVLDERVRFVGLSLLGVICCLWSYSAKSLPTGYDRMVLLESDKGVASGVVSQYRGRKVVLTAAHSFSSCEKTSCPIKIYQLEESGSTQRVFDGKACLQKIVRDIGLLQFDKSPIFRRSSKLGERQNGFYCMNFSTLGVSSVKERNTIRKMAALLREDLSAVKVLSRKPDIVIRWVQDINAYISRLGAAALEFDSFRIESILDWHNT